MSTVSNNSHIQLYDNRQNIIMIITKYLSNFLIYLNVRIEQKSSICGLSLFITTHHIINSNSQ